MKEIQVSELPVGHECVMRCGCIVKISSHDRDGRGIWFQMVRFCKSDRSQCHTNGAGGLIWPGAYVQYDPILDAIG